MVEVIAIYMTMVLTLEHIIMASGITVTVTIGHIGV